MIKIGVIGYGYWGPNIVRNFSTHKDCQVVTVCDKSPKALARVTGAHPGVRTTTDPDEGLVSL
jgi:predicted dehydrogenase